MSTASPPPHAPFLRRAADGIRGALAGARRFVTEPSQETAPVEAELGRAGKAIAALLIAAPMVVTGIMLLPEVTIPVPNLNDDAFQYLLIQRMSETLAAGQNPLDLWVGQLELGFPQALYYQHLPHLVVVLLDRLTLGAVDLFTMFNLVRWVLFVALPLTVFWSMRRMGFSVMASAVAAAASPLLSGETRYGFEYDSYIWRGFGMYTQAWAMHLSFIVMACIYRVVNRGTGYILAIAVLSLLVLSHLVYAYMMVITVVLIVIVGARRATIVPRFVRLGIVGFFAALMTAYQWLPFVTMPQYLSATPYLQPYKFDSFGAPTILGWLVTGDLLDHGRLPVLTALLGLGIVVALLRRSTLTIFTLVGFAVWLVLYFGRPTLGPLFDYFPLHDGLLIHRFIGSVELFAIPLMGLGGALVYDAIQRVRIGSVSTGRLRGWGRPVIAGVLLLFVLVPAMSERSEYYRQNTIFMERSYRAVQTDAGLQDIVETLRKIPGGRVYAGLREDWGGKLTLGDLNVRDVLTFNMIPVVGPPYQGLSLNSSLIWWFRDQEPSQFDLVDARYVVTPRTLVVPDFHQLVKATGKYALYRVPTTGVAQYVKITARTSAPAQRWLFDRNVEWFRGAQPAAREYTHWDYLTEAGTPDLSAGCPDGGRTLFENDEPQSITLVVECSVAAPLVLKVTYHPNWTVTVDGQAAETFMASPSYVGVHLPAGKHQVEAAYRPTPSKMPLLALGLVLFLVAILLRHRLDRLPTWIGSLRWRRDRRPADD